MEKAIKISNNLETTCCNCKAVRGKNPIIHLNEDIITTEILPRLPVKSLIKFRCVCKAWNSLISSSNKNFIKSHLRNSTNDKSLTYRGIIAYLILKPAAIKFRGRGYTNQSHFIQCSLLSWFYETSTFSIDDFTFINNDYTQLMYDSILIVGSCNGLCCVQKGKKEFFLWNPATKESHKLPDLPVDVIPNRRHCITRAGFGFDEANDDYKVMVIAQYYLEVDHQWVNEVKLYSSRANSWKTVQNFKDADEFSFSANLLNGKLHWCTYETIRRPTLVISSFDLEEEEYGLVESPESLDCYRLESLGILDGCLSCVLSHRHKIQVWIMKEYGLKDSWHLIASGSDFRPNLCIVPISMAHGGEILFSYGSGFMIYDPKTKIRINFDWPGSFLHAHVYVESLVSPVPESIRGTPC